MTEEKNQPLYLTKESLQRVHLTLSAWTVQIGDEPIPSFEHANEADIDALIYAPQQRFFGADAYPTLAEKAAIIFYTINKRQIFLNGNKRMSTLCLLVFLGINGKELTVSADELTAKALWLAKTPSLEFQEIKTDLANWIRTHMRDAPAQSDDQNAS